MSFTKSTTDIVVHQKLGDNPNIEDGKTAAQLKEMFDFPAETLQNDLNTHIDELAETTSAGLIGATALSEGDTTDGNIQAKLGYLQEEIEGVSQGAVADGSITQAKMNTTYEATLAKKNGTLQTNLNAEMLGGYNLTQVLDYVKPVIGSYIGTAVNHHTETYVQEIQLGFKPSAVLIRESKPIPESAGISSTIRAENLLLSAFDGAPQKVKSNGIIIIECTETGFKAGAENDYDRSAITNEKDVKYNYIAFK